MAGRPSKMTISKIKPNPDNPRVIKDDKFKKLVKSLKDFPEMTEVRPIVVNKQMMVLGGNMRLRAMQEAGWKEVPVTVVDWSKEKQREFIVKDNLGYGEWDWEILANEWDAEALNEWGMDTPDTWGKDLDAEEDNYEVPNEIETDLVLGDLIEIGEHRLLCGDSTDADAVARLLGGIKADMVFTDPPYNIDYGNIKHPKFKARSIQNDAMGADEFRSFCRLFAENIKNHNKGCVYVCGAPVPDGRIMFVELDNALHCSTVIIWNKDQFTLGRGKYQNKYEPIWFGWVTSGNGFYGDRKQTNVWDIERPKASAEHPTMKPVALVARAVNHASREDDTCLDLFCGSGTTMVACEQLGRKCYAMEIDPKYCQVVIDRMLKLNPELTVKVNGKELKAVA